MDHTVINAGTKIPEGSRMKPLLVQPPVIYVLACITVQSIFRPRGKIGHPCFSRKNENARRFWKETPQPPIVYVLSQ